MSERRNVDVARLSKAADSFSTSARYELIASYIDFPVPVSGLTILDIGGGASSATLRLRDQGAIAYSVDIRYRNLIELQGSVEKYFEHLYDPVPYIAQFKDLPPDAEYKASNETSAPTQRPSSRFGMWLSRKLANLVGGYGTKSRLAYGAFLEHLSQDPSAYIAARAEQLPFDNESIDFCYSVECLSAFLLDNSELFVRAGLEALRVLKPGGELQIYPWITENQRIDRRIWTPVQWKNTDYFTKTLRKRGIHYSLKDDKDCSLLKVLKSS